MYWFYEKNGIRHDNVSEDNMVRRIKEGELTASTLVWQPGMTEWQPVSATPLAYVLTMTPSPPDLPSHRLPQGLSWILAFAPLIGLFLEGVAGGIAGMDEAQLYDAVSNGQFWYITLLLNIVLSYADERQLRNAGVDTTQFGKMAWLVPVYLWRRSRSLKLSPATFWVWIVTFVMVMLM
ncbi:DUF4339 domain-containing protein [Enterobacter asburiae]|uniref:DUF4339 domain-containing protein n=1 Tax=Enterobacter asburiae TaxID=61645 RepID=UPI00192AEA29|nr:DUF4339 domain-containing protein [Enterobacter asburiae]MBL5945851.1 DUF4339 domain-containing protein [Enterobacter asburiae]MBL5954373.1 DUF4339 domain-containing protein [Enterobacter asburiae]